jgi:hypothetical protein
MMFEYIMILYQSAGVAIPVSGIKTTESSGIGEFLDLKKVTHTHTHINNELFIEFLEFLDLKKVTHTHTHTHTHT